MGANKEQKPEDPLRGDVVLLQGLFDNMTSGAAVYEVRGDGSTGADYIIKDLNATSLKIENKTREEVVGKSLRDLRPNIDDYGLIPVFRKVWQTGEPAFFPSHLYVDDRYTNWYETKVFRLPTGEIVAIYDDVTERKHAEIYQHLSVEVLSILNEIGTFDDSIRRVLFAVKKVTRCDAAGIRLQKGEDFPYFLQNGFSNDFLLAENSLIARDPKGGICRNPDGAVSLECTCGLIVSGKTDPSNPLFTPGGSAWTNDSLPFLDIPESDDPRHHPRNTCIHKGYASIALIPIRASNTIVGILQLNGHAKGLFSLAAVQALEGIAAHIGEALLRKQAEERVRKSMQDKEALHQLMLGRENRVLELKKEINDMLASAGKPPRYAITH